MSDLFTEQRCGTCVQRNAREHAPAGYCEFAGEERTAEQLPIASDCWFGFLQIRQALYGRKQERKR